MLDYFWIVQKHDNCIMNRNNFIGKTVYGEAQLEQWLQNNANHLNVSVIQDQVDQSNRVVIGKAQLEQWLQNNAISLNASELQNRDAVSDNNNSKHRKCSSGKFLGLKRKSFDEKNSSDGTNIEREHFFEVIKPILKNPNGEREITNKHVGFDSKVNVLLFDEEESPAETQNRVKSFKDIDFSDKKRDKNEGMIHKSSYKVADKLKGSDLKKSFIQIGDELITKQW